MYLAPVYVAVIAVLVLAGLNARRKGSRPPLPPGPKGYPLVGNIAENIGLFDWKQFYKARALWGDITSVTLLGTTIVTVHTYEKAVELLDKKSLIHSGRPDIQMFTLGGLENHVSMLPYGSQLKECRRMLRSELNPIKMKEYFSIQEATTKRLLKALNTSPDKFYDTVEWYTGSIVLQIVYGYETLDHDDPFIDMANKVLSSIDLVTKPGYVIEAIPWLRYIPAWVPYTGFQRDAAKLRGDYTRMLHTPFEYAKSQLNAPGEVMNFVSVWLKRITTERQFLYLKESALILFGGGVETTSSILLAFLASMQANPEVQKKAQVELDAVVGTDRLPSFNDRENLPYINALCKELIRLNPPLPAGIPRKTQDDDIHDGMYIPKGSVVLPSIREMSRDPAVYKDPETLNPTRFLGANPERDPSLYAFGFGRRVCPGLIFAQNTVFIAVSMLLSTFDISTAANAAPAKLHDGQGLLNHPPPFECLITPRAGIASLEDRMRG